MAPNDVFLSCYFQLSLQCTWQAVDAIFRHLDAFTRESMILCGEIRTRGLSVLEHMKKTSPPSKGHTSCASWEMPNSSLSFAFWTAHVNLRWQIGVHESIHDITPYNRELATRLFQTAPLLLHVSERFVNCSALKVLHWNTIHGDTYISKGLCMRIEDYRLYLNNIVCNTPDECDRVLDAVGAHRQ